MLVVCPFHIGSSSNKHHLLENLILSLLVKTRFNLENNKQNDSKNRVLLPKSVTLTKHFVLIVAQELKPISKICDMRHLELCLIFPVVPELYRLGQYP